MEENEIEKIDPEYLKGYNLGYELNKLAPELTKTLHEIQGKSQRLIGFLDGQKQIVITKEDILPNWMKKDIFKELAEKDKQELEKNKDKTKDDGIEKYPGQ